mgnify:CR=1 FL=1
MRKTKIICTLGPAVDNPDILEKLMLAGMDVARINFSHGNYEEQQDRIERVKEVRKRTNKNIAILYDTKGPEFRSGVAKEDGISLVSGKTIKIVKEDVIGNEERFTVNHKTAIDALQIGDIVLLENGLMKIEVIEKADDYVNCKIINGGILFSKKSLSAPGVDLNIPFISDIDRYHLCMSTRRRLFSCIFC